VILAARGASLSRKALFATATVVVFFLLRVLLIVTGLASAAAATANEPSASLLGGQVLAAGVQETLSLAIPLAALALFVGRQPSLLWVSRATKQEAKRGVKWHGRR
jgi:hypothetical protein